MKSLPLLIIIYFISAPVFGQVDWVDAINRKEKIRTKSKNSTAKANIKTSKWYYYRKSKKNLNYSYHDEKPFLIHEYDSLGNKIAEYHPSFYDSSKKEIEYSYNPENYSYNDKLFNVLNNKTKLKDYSKYYFDANGRCNLHITRNVSGVKKTKINYNLEGHITSLLHGNDSTYSDTTNVNLKYDSSGRLISSEICGHSLQNEENCYQHKQYFYVGDSVIIHHSLNDWVFQRTIQWVDTSGALRLYEKIEYENGWLPNNKKNKILHCYRRGYDEFGNLTELLLFDSRLKKSKTHHFFYYELDIHGNVLNTVIRNNKGKFLKSELVIHEFYWQF